MKLLKVGAAALNQTPLDWEGNRENIVGAIEAARAAGVRLLCLPEMCIPGYGCEDAYLSSSMQATAVEVLHEILPSTGGMIVSVGLPLQHSNVLFNCAGLLCDGRILGFVAKRHLAGEGIYYEQRWFRPWPAGLRSEVRFEDTKYPLGEYFFDCGGVKIGFEICEDAWVAKRPGAELSARGVDVILNPSASHFAFGKLQVRKRFVLEGSRAFGVSYVYANLLGNEAGRIIFDGGSLIASNGELVAVGPRFSFADHVVTSAVVDIDATRASRARATSHEPNLEDDGACIATEFTFDRCKPEPRRLEVPAWERSANLKKEEFSRAVPLALLDYLRKSRSRGFVVSASGGADSSGVMCLVSLMVTLASQELGLPGLLERIRHSDLAATTDAEVVRRLLLCVYQSTRNSSRTTRDAARAVTSAIGAEFMELDVDHLVEGYKAVITDAIGRELTWEKDDLALQNIQARTRAPSVWMLANLRDSLLLSTSNRSEAAVGYATMDGDTSGGLSPIAGIDKAFLREWLLWLEAEGPDGVDPLPALACVNEQQPTAELRPPEAKQSDEDDLMPYEILDAIERAAIRDKNSPVEVLSVLQVTFEQYELTDLAAWVERFFNLWCRNQWKRERYAPSFHLDDENLDPKTWCRFPILSGGFQRELEQLREYIRTDDIEMTKKVAAKLSSFRGSQGAGDLGLQQNESNPDEQ